MSSGSEESMLFCRYLIANQKNTRRKLTTGFTIYKTLLWITYHYSKNTRNLAPSIGKGAACQITNGSLQLFLETVQCS